MAHKHKWRLYHVGRHQYYYLCLCSEKLIVSKSRVKEAVTGDTSTNLHMWARIGWAGLGTPQ